MYWQNINTSSSEKLDITRKESYPVPLETHPLKKKTPNQIPIVKA